MKSTYRAKYNALCAMNDGNSFITIKRCNKEYVVYLEDILATPNGKKVTEYEQTYRYQFETLKRVYKSKDMTFTDLMNYNK